MVVLAVMKPGPGANLFAIEDIVRMQHNGNSLSLFKKSGVELRFEAQD